MVGLGFDQGVRVISSFIGKSPNRESWGKLFETDGGKGAKIRTLVAQAVFDFLVSTPTPSSNQIQAILEYKGQFSNLLAAPPKILALMNLANKDYWSDEDQRATLFGGLISNIAKSEDITNPVIEFLGQGVIAPKARESAYALLARINEDDARGYLKDQVESCEFAHLPVLLQSIESYYNADSQFRRELTPIVARRANGLDDLLCLGSCARFIAGSKEHRQHERLANKVIDRFCDVLNERNSAEDLENLGVRHAIKAVANLGSPSIRLADAACYRLANNYWDCESRYLAKIPERALEVAQSVFTSLDSARKLPFLARVSCLDINSDTLAPFLSRNFSGLPGEYNDGNLLDLCDSLSERGLSVPEIAPRLAKYVEGNGVLLASDNPDRQNSVDKGHVVLKFANLIGEAMVEALVARGKEIDLFDNSGTSTDRELRRGRYENIIDFLAEAKFEAPQAREGGLDLLKAAYEKFKELSTSNKLMYLSRVIDGTHRFLARADGVDVPTWLKASEILSQSGRNFCDDINSILFFNKRGMQVDYATLIDAALTYSRSLARGSRPERNDLNALKSLAALVFDKCEGSLSSVQKRVVTEIRGLEINYDERKLSAAILKITGDSRMAI